jgi:hypothetical protein
VIARLDPILHCNFDFIIVLPPAKLVANVNIAGLPRDAGYAVFAFADVSVNGALVCTYSN